MHGNRRGRHGQEQEAAWSHSHPHTGLLQSEQEVRPGINPQNSVTTWGQLYEVWAISHSNHSAARVFFSLVETTYKQLNTEYVSGGILWEKCSN